VRKGTHSCWECKPSLSLLLSNAISVLLTDNSVKVAGARSDASSVPPTTLSACPARPEAAPAGARSLPTNRGLRVSCRTAD